MLKKVYLIVVISLVSLVSFAQTGTLKGVITDAVSGESIPFANLVIEKNGNQTAGTTTDFDGKYTIKPIDPGNYNIKATFVGYQTVEVTGVIVSANKITYQDIQLQEGVALGEVKIIEYKKPLLDKDNLAGETKTSEEIVALPTKSVNTIAATTAGIYQRDEGDAVNIRGSRDNATEYYIDGIKVRGAIQPPASAIEQITVVTGGLEAKYGDATGGIISIATKGPSSKFSGGFEIESSSLFDEYHYNLGALNFSGPILKKRNSDGTKGRTILGYFVAGQFEMQADTDPSALGIWKVKDNTLADLRESPFTYTNEGGFLSTSTFLTEDDYENVQERQNNNRQILNVSGKLDFQPIRNTQLTLGGSYYSRGSNDFSHWRSMFSSDNNRYSTQMTYRLFGKLTQKFGSEEYNNEKSSATVKNAFFTVMGDYTNNRYTYGDPNHMDGNEFNLFNYGYVGEFNTHKSPRYTRANILHEGIWYNDVNALLTWADDSMTFNPNQYSNQYLVNYTQAYYDLFEDNDVALPFGTPGVIRNRSDLQSLGLSNGESPASVYSLFGNHGSWYSYAVKEENTQLSFKASGSADIKNHEFSFGVEYEQRQDYYWQVNLWRNLWLLGDLLANKHIEQRDLSNPIFDTLPNGIFTGIVNYNRLYQEADQSTFDQRLREALNKPIDGLEYLDINSYLPKELSLNYFGEDELLNSGNPYVYYYGFDMYGNKVDPDASLQEFFRNFNPSDAGLDPSKRHIQPFSPIMTSAYIQDKFDIEDLIVKIGVRFERYDANQKVLKDRYLLYPAYVAGAQNDNNTFWDGMTEYTDNQTGHGIHPTTIEDDYVVYVDAEKNATKVVGYRNGDTWYNSTGLEISDPSLLADAAGGKITPYLIFPDDAASGIIDVEESFKDYETELIVMPRVSFNFPISDEAQFFAHYDVLTQRPQSNSRLEPVDYLFMADRVGAVLNNPALKPEKTIDYEVGFAKALNLRSALKISAFYKEMRDMVTRINTLGAYPAQYITYGNQDFGTVKGLTINYDLRRYNNIRMTANYTLQFTDGTGSSATSGQNIVNTGQPNLRTTNPLDYDQRHSILASVDYHYSRGKEYNGPIIFGKKILQEAGMNVIMTAGSGTPFSRQSNVTQEAASGINDRSVMDGTINGSRLPWQFRLSMKLDKTFEIKWTDKKRSSLNIYVQVQNLLNTKNIIEVYRKTGNPDDDGYLADESSLNAIQAQNDEAAFRYLYSLDVNDYSHYSRPRMWRAGMTMNF